MNEEYKIVTASVKSAQYLSWTLSHLTDTVISGDYGTKDYLILPSEHSVHLLKTLLCIKKSLAEYSHSVEV